jgi:enamine deaminase RidA (YjgF/YER057c/UK114 family)
LRGNAEQGNTNSLRGGHEKMNMESILCTHAPDRVSAIQAGQGQVFLVASVQSAADAAVSAREAYVRIAETLSEHRLEIVHERIFGSLSVEPSVMAARHRALRTCGIAPDNPVTYVQGNPPWGEGLAGAIIHAVSPDKPGDVWTITDRGNPCGRGWQKNNTTWLVLQNISGNHLSSGNNGNRPLHVREMIDRAERILRENGASYRDVARTWFYLPHILDWYAGFNKIRNERYGELGIMPGPGDEDLLLPASTGISGETPSGAPATMDLIAVKRESVARPLIKQLTNAGQLDAFRYGSAFSRGALIHDVDVSLIEISGTAAIDERGKSRFIDDIRGQIDCTFDKIEKLLGGEGATLGDIAAATVFVKRPEYGEVFREVACERGLEDFPAVCVVADVCRDELLFEIDAEAVIAGSGRRSFDG